MDVYKINDIGALIKGNPYVGRGIVLGRAPSGRAISSWAAAPTAATGFLP